MRLFKTQRLGLILGSKIFVNFTKYSFEECMLRLRKEIKNLLPESFELDKSNPKSILETKILPPLSILPPPPINKLTINHPKKWTNEVS